ncbi:DNA polymerase III subunit epsilon [Hydrogenovibrio marinus]|nr:DNA polymerase III subunit epsilon [Hydrogenovibrio marinus]
MDTETTGLDPKSGDKIIEIGAVELVERKLTHKNYHQYIQPERDVPEDAIAVHGITNEFLEDKPIFSDVVDDFMAFVAGAELIIHNAPFDVGFINHELSQLKNNRWGKIEDHCTITDSLKMARKSFPGQRNTLDALCKRFGIDNSNRTLHGALLDSEILADVYLAMTGGQTALSLHEEYEGNVSGNVVQLDVNRPKLKVLKATDDELMRHQQKLEAISKKFGETLSW